MSDATLTLKYDERDGALRVVVLVERSGSEKIAVWGGKVCG
jgi:hypothetical protein